ncbi:hypothetical protein G9U51_00810 [Calidifontibacter sp. DB0510]|uniref:LGFP repeat-containing protein n=1 Tax=Metallococcus carri TaxID=1656884 RepID=A0A967AZ69_9MICO|nr:hypothetical protein [Metallococcus carri]NHN54325.1 hypothetical protein [Metallococcus carri]NOP36835.1 hypothetical protein [Calidifontibacter sp. DB2511S]
MRRTGLLTATVVALTAAGSSPAFADPGHASAYNANGIRTAGASVLACYTYPTTRDINVTRRMYAIADARNVSQKVMLGMFEAGWVESWLNNLDCGDADSIGIFQMRPSMGWGTYEQLRNVDYQVNKWIDVALPLESKASTPGTLAQMVERSAYPYRYDQAQATAQKYINEAILPYGTIGDLWTRSGGASGSYGSPLAVQAAYTATSQWVPFAKGAIISSSRGTYGIAGQMYSVYNTAGGKSRFGYPVWETRTGMTSPFGTTGLKQGFVPGRLFWSSKTGAHVIKWAMTPTFDSLGGEAKLGYPTTETNVSVDGTVVQRFEKSIVTRYKDGRVVVTANRVMSAGPVSASPNLR